MSAHSSLARRGAEIRRGAASAILLACLLAAAAASGQETAWKPPEMVFVPGGTFTMGTNFLGDDEKPEHQVTVSPFYISRYEITVGDYASIDEFFKFSYVQFTHAGNVWNGKEWVNDKSADWENPGFSQEKRHPIVLMTWEDAAAYCNYLSMEEGLETVYLFGDDKLYKADFSKNGYRLPTEAEWEFAAGGGAIDQRSRTRFIGSNRPDEASWYERNSGGATHPAGALKPNQLGLYDMGGNAAEWCDDWFGPYAKDPVTDPRGPASGKDKVIKGGSFTQGMNSTMAGYRDHAGRLTAWNDTGFRVVRASGPGTAMPFVTTTTTTTIAYRKPELVPVEGGTLAGKAIRGFYIGKYEVSNAEFAQFADASGYKTTAETGGGGFIYYRDKKTWERKADATWRNPYFAKTDGTPAVHMSWYDAAEYCNWLSDLESLPRAYSKQGNAYAVDLNARGYRLPTEAEWEWAARGGLKSKGYKFAGSDKSEDVVWSDYWAKGGGPSSAGALKPNELGIYAMCGSVWEWCAELTPQTDKPGTFKAALRGGSWTNTGDYCTIDRRTTDFPEGTDFTFGFRVMRLK